MRLINSHLTFSFFQSMTALLKLGVYKQNCIKYIVIKNNLFVNYSGQGSLINIDCSSVQAISFAIDIPDIAQWDTAIAADVDAWALNGKTDDASCKPFFNQGTGYVEYAAFSVVNCADEPTVSSDGTKLRYTFVIDVAAAAGPTVLPATLQNDHQYTVTCFYDREQTNLQASFEPLHPSTEEGSGKSEVKRKNSLV